MVHVYHRKKTRLERVAMSGSSRDSVRGSVGAMNAELSRPDGLATFQSAYRLPRLILRPVVRRHGVATCRPAY